MGKKVLVFIPTYNERENVTPLYEGIRKLGLGLDVLFLDDNSPDGTGAVLDEIAARDESVRVIHRAGKQGIGSAHMDGLGWAYDNEYDTLVTMDCDFTHDPADIPAFLAAAEVHDIAVGSRYMREDSLRGWVWYRKALTNLGHFVTKHLLGMPYDATGAYRVYSLGRINRDVFSMVKSRGYSFFFESLYALMLNGASIKEIPIDLPTRTYGHSKMSPRDIAQSVVRLWGVYLGCKLNRRRYLVQRSKPEGPRNV
jgi:dolichol-phosphate mannosyltransferase